MLDYVVNNIIENQKIIGAARTKTTGPVPTPPHLVRLGSKLNAGNDIRERSKFSAYSSGGVGDPKIVYGPQRNSQLLTTRCLSSETAKSEGKQLRSRVSPAYLECQK